MGTSGLLELPLLSEGKANLEVGLHLRLQHLATLPFPYSRSPPSPVTSYISARNTSTYRSQDQALRKEDEEHSLIRNGAKQLLRRTVAAEDKLECLFIFSAGFLETSIRGMNHLFTSGTVPNGVCAGGRWCRLIRYVSSPSYVVDLTCHWGPQSSLHAAPGLSPGAGRAVYAGEDGETRRDSHFNPKTTASTGWLAPQ